MHCIGILKGSRTSPESLAPKYLTAMNWLLLFRDKAGPIAFAGRGNFYGGALEAVELRIVAGVLCLQSGIILLSCL